MSETRFLQIHTLHAYPGVLLNRDDAGLAKRLPFGGTTRARISSQCLKRRWRTATDPRWSFDRIGVPLGQRSKVIVERAILAGHNLAEPKVKAVAEALWKNLYGEKATDPKNRQALFFGEPEIAYLRAKAEEALAAPDAKAATKVIEDFFKAERENLRALKDGAGLESALFGRMVTSDPASNRDAAIHVAHAFTVHAIERELDYMTVVDDLLSREEGDDPGAAGLFDMELTSGLYYGYVVVDVPLLVSNLTGDRDLAGRVVEHLIHLIATVSPGAKKGSTAPYAYAEFMLVEAGDGQPRTLANAFRDAIPLRSNRLLDETVGRLAAHLSRLDQAFGGAPERRVLNLSATPLEGVATDTLDGLAAWARERVAADATTEAAP
jgi:CRISPR system Cascade subunit CasC